MKCIKLKKNEKNKLNVSPYFPSASTPFLKINENVHTYKFIHVTRSVDHYFCCLQPVWKLNAVRSDCRLRRFCF